VSLCIQAIDIIYSCAGRVIVTGMGQSGLIGKKISATLASTGTPALFLHPAEGGHGDIGMVSKGDAVIAISNSGETEEIIRILPALKRLDIKLIALTGNTNSALARVADVVLDVSVREEACSIGLVPTASTTAALAMGDALVLSSEKEISGRRTLRSSTRGGTLAADSCLLLVSLCIQATPSL
jgi:arabinose-5-phosphate isomerase